MSVWASPGRLQKDMEPCRKTLTQSGWQIGQIARSFSSCSAHEGRQFGKPTKSPRNRSVAANRIVRKQCNHRFLARLAARALRNAGRKSRCRSVSANTRSGKRWQESFKKPSLLARPRQALQVSARASSKRRHQLSPCYPCEEVFDLNDTPTWLAQMQKRREQAQRAGKDKSACRALRREDSQIPSGFSFA